ncbi:MAG TPA: hypothetical protein VF384_18835 [Planctomycetota bacterium]
MGHIVFAAPGIDRFHLHERLRRELLQRGHTVTVLCLDAVSHTFWRHQDVDTACIEPGSPTLQGPFDELALRECQRRGLRPGSLRERRTRHRVRDRLARCATGLARWFERARCDLVLLHRDRSAEHHLVQFAAQQAGCRVLWTGNGLLPHTLQADERGLDGDARALSRSAGDYRVVRGEPSLLEACLTSLLASTSPSALPAREPAVPPLWSRLCSVWPALTQRGLGGARAALSAWRGALPPPPGGAPPQFELPGRAFVTVLLQDDDDERVRLDAASPPAAHDLVAAAALATAKLDPRLCLLVVEPPRGLRQRAFQGLQLPAQVHVLPPHAGPVATATAVATITINHPLASAGLLAGTPVVHTGSALYGLRGVTTKVATLELPDALRAAVERDHPTLRQRFLSWLFGYGHVWCSATLPDHNGLMGLVQVIEARLGPQPPNHADLHYLKGPSWPLAAERRGH